MSLDGYLNRAGNKDRWKLCAFLAVALHIAAFAGSSLLMARQAQYGMAGAVAGGGIPKIAQPPEEATVELEVSSDDTLSEKHKPKPKPRVQPTGVGGAVSGGALEVPNYYRNPPPTYPDEARRLKEEGLVMLHVDVDSKGLVSSVSLAQSSGFSILDDSALRAVKFWRFKPATMAGIPISSSVNVPVRFRLQDIR